MLGHTARHAWLIDPWSYYEYLNVGLNNAKTQTDGHFYGHSKPNALSMYRAFDKSPAVIGFASDGLPLYGTIIRDSERKKRSTISGYSLKEETPVLPSGPGGKPDGNHIDEYTFAVQSDPDRYNGTAVGEQFGHYGTTIYL